MSRKSEWFLIGVASVLLAVFFGLGRAAPQGGGRLALLATPAQDRFALEEGGRLYTHYCQPCHGESGRGDGRFYASALEPTPPDFTASAFWSSHTERQLQDTIVRGSASVGKSDLCPPWGKTFLSSEVGYLIAYIKQLQNTTESAPVKSLP